MKHNLSHEDQRCDGAIANDAENEYCQRRHECQRYIAHKTDPDKKAAAWMIPIRNCNKFIAAKP